MWKAFKFIHGCKFTLDDCYKINGVGDDEKECKSGMDCKSSVCGKGFRVELYQEKLTI